MVRAYDPVGGERRAPLAPELKIADRPVRGMRGRGRARACSPSGTSSAGSTSTGRRLDGRGAASSTPATCSTPSSCAASASTTRASGADGPRASSPGERGSSDRTSAGRCSARGDDVVAVDNFVDRPARERRRPRRRPGFTLVEHDVVEPFPTTSPSTGRASTRCCTSRARRARRSTSRTRSSRSRPGRLGTHTRPRRATAQRRRGSCSRRRARCTATRPCTRSPRPTGATSTRSGYARCTTRRSATPRRIDDGVPPRPRARRQDRRASSTPTARGLAAGDGRVVSNFLSQALARRPLTVYGDGTQTRSFCYVDDKVARDRRAARLRLRRRR